MNLPNSNDGPSRTKFSAVTKGSTVFHAVRRLILLGEIQSDQPLVEQHLGREFNCSQGTVREALMRLQEEGLVERRGYRGTIIAQTGIAEAIQMARIRLDLEVEGIRHAALSFDDTELDEIRGMLNNMEKVMVLGDQYAVSEIDRLIHLTIFRSSGLMALEPILKRCTLHMHRFTFGSEETRDRRISPIESHQPILDALASHDPERAAEAMRTHIAEVIELWAPPLKSALGQSATNH